MQEKIKPSGWVTLLRVMAYVQVVLGCVASAIGGIVIIYTSVTTRVPSGIAVGLLVLVLGVLLSFVGAAMTMVLMGIAEDVHAVRVMAERRQ